MPKFTKAIDIWEHGDAVRRGEIKLQCGQWVRLGPDGTLSRFHHANEYHITAFHYPKATEKFRAYVNACKGDNQ